MEDEIIRQGAISSANLILAQNPASFKNNQSTYESLYKQNGFNIAYTKDELLFLEEYYEQINNNDIDNNFEKYFTLTA